MEKSIIILAPCDNVGVLTFDYKGIKAGHKIALKDIKKGDSVIKYGYSIGYATENINKYEWVHTHNLISGLNENLEYSYSKIEVSKKEAAKGSFLGYKRANGSVGTREEIRIKPTVGCVNNIVRRLESIACSRYKNIDAVVALTHPYGCSQMGDDEKNTIKILSRLAQHPNAAATLIVGLGCENNNINVFKKHITENNERIKFISLQDVEDDIEAALDQLDKLYEIIKEDTRVECDISDLTVGLKCGGSDGYSGITANPLLGMVTDSLTSAGCRCILTEVPEMFGSELKLMERCVDYKCFKKTVSLINDFKDYYKFHNQVIYENPSPGNKDGGITTLEEKSLGCTFKGGSSEVVDVLDYGDVAEKTGLNLLKSPGNDIVAITALAASEANIILFTTGRGTPLGSVVPTIKISSNSNIFNKKQQWIDYDAGRMLIEDNNKLKAELLDYIIKVASGELTKNEKNGYREIAIFKTGVTL